MTSLRVLIADDHVLFRDGLRTLLQSAPEIEVVGEATDGAEVIALATTCQPDVILMDIQMPAVNGIEATRHITQSHPDIKVLILTMFEDDLSVFAAMRAGARGYILKGADHEEMLRAVRAIGGGEAIFSPSIAGRMIDYFANMHTTPEPDAFPELSEREREVLDLIAQGYKNADIAAQLVLSPKTVRNYVTNILSKLQVADRAQAIIRAREAGLGRE
jgi:DNA-binding NarL/FixJ family response regulator